MFCEPIAVNLVSEMKYKETTSITSSKGTPFALCNLDDFNSFLFQIGAGG
jgi:hypothetical protein